MRGTETTLKDPVSDFVSDGGGRDESEFYELSLTVGGALSIPIGEPRRAGGIT